MRINNSGNRALGYEMVEAITFIGADNNVGSGLIEQPRNVLQMFYQINLMLDNVCRKACIEPFPDDFQVAGCLDIVDVRYVMQVTDPADSLRAPATPVC